MHHKFIIVDAKLVVMGSYNPTTRATSHSLDGVSVHLQAGDVKHATNEFMTLWSCEERASRTSLPQSFIISSPSVDGSRATDQEESAREQTRDRQVRHADPRTPTGRSTQHADDGRAARDNARALGDETRYDDDGRAARDNARALGDETRYADPHRRAANIPRHAPTPSSGIDDELLAAIDSIALGDLRGTDVKALDTFPNVQSLSAVQRLEKIPKWMRSAGLDIEGLIPKGNAGGIYWKALRALGRAELKEMESLPTIQRGFFRTSRRIPDKLKAADARIRPMLFRALPLDDRKFAIYRRVEALEEESLYTSVDIMFFVYRLLWIGNDTARIEIEQGAAKIGRAHV
jgi:hypothetical protein